MLSCAPDVSGIEINSDSIVVNVDEKATLHIHLALIVGLRISLHQLHSEVLVVQFMHNALTMHKVVDEQQSFHRFITTGGSQQVAQNSLIRTACVVQRKPKPSRLGCLAEYSRDKASSIRAM